MEKVRVVLADDHALVRAGISNALRELSYLKIVEEVGDGLSLLAALKKKPAGLPAHRCDYARL